MLLALILAYVWPANFPTLQFSRLSGFRLTCRHQLCANSSPKNCFRVCRVVVDIEVGRVAYSAGPGDGGDYIYDLYGVVNHRGSTWYGHYVALIRCYNVPNTDSDEVGWRACDDENVEPEDNLTRLVDRGAYLLFYRRRGTPNPILIPSLDDSDSPDDYSDENGANG